MKKKIFELYFWLNFFQLPPNIRFSKIYLVMKKNFFCGTPHFLKNPNMKTKKKFFSPKFFHKIVKNLIAYEKKIFELYFFWLNFFELPPNFRFSKIYLVIKFLTFLFGNEKKIFFLVRLIF